MSETHTKTGEGVLVDVVRESPVDKYLLRFRRRVLLVLLLLALVLVALCLLRRRDHGKPAEGGAASGYSAAQAELPPGYRGARGANS
jgi:hypothetical protein